jgi:trans-aconitate methyltransferase
MTVYTNLEDYQNPIFYDAEMDRLGVTDDFYLKLAQRFGGDVLELGCGTGRYTIPIAQQEISITGLDIVPQMLAHAKSKSADLPIQWVEADARDFHLGRQFRFIFESGAMFCHLQTRPDYEALLATIREHLEPDGFFAVSSRFIHAGTILSTEAEEDWFTYTTSRGEEVRVSGYQQYDEMNQITIETAVRRWTDAAGQEQVQISPLKLRHFSPPELEALLHYNGFKVTESYGDTDFSPLTDASPNIIYLCQLR